jgi:hypothetical protein
MEHRKNDNGPGLHGEVHGIGKAPDQGATDSRLESLIPKGLLRDPIVRVPQLLEELPAEPSLLALIPLVRCRDVEIRSRLGNQPILGHRVGFVRCRKTS